LIPTRTYAIKAEWNPFICLWWIRGRSEWQSRAIPLSVVTDELDFVTKLMKECLECRRLEIHIKNLEQGFCTEKLKAVSGGHSIVDKDRRYEHLLRLSHELESKRRELKQHRKTHFTVH
jgi:hypothetical protein